MKPSTALQAHRAEVRAIAAESRLVNLRVFGSAARGDDRDGSDLDLLVESTRGLSLFDLMKAEERLESALGVPVELLTPEDFPPRIRESILREAVAV